MSYGPAQPANNIVSLDEYQRAALKTDQNEETGLDGLPFFLLGLFGEVGTLLSVLKKKRRDQESYAGYDEAIIEEFGDSLWYFSIIASRASFKLSTLAQKSFRDLQDWEKVSDKSLETFDGVQRERNQHGSADSQKFESALISLAGHVGVLLHDLDLKKFSKNRDALSALLINIFKALIEAANVADISLRECAEANLKKTQNRWPTKRIYTPLFDDDNEPLERFPRKIEMEIFEIKKGGKTHVIQRCNGINIGDLLTDNKMQPDDYRFHDVFHLGYIAVLGWSPVLRGLFKLKRKSDPKVDENQDGQRAILIEEGVTALIFQRALRLKYFEEIMQLDYPLLKLIPEFVSGYEVEKCPLWQWEEAILAGYAVFRKLRHYRRGIVTADLIKRKLLFRELPK